MKVVCSRAAVGLMTAWLALAAQPLAAAPSNVTVVVNDNGFNPPTVTIPVGGSVNWINQGTDTHDATSSSAPLPINTGGLGVGQSAGMGFGLAGVYHYSSAADCYNGVVKPGFNCGVDYTVTVTAAGAAPAAPAVPAPAPQAAPAPAAVGSLPSNVTVTITDTGFSPPTAAVAVGGTVTFVNQGSNVHTATSGSAPLQFDTGGLATGQSNSAGLGLAGVYHYSSAPDCQSGNSSVTFNCNTDYTITATNTPPSPTVPAASAPAPAPAPAAPASTAGIQQNATVTITDSGFSTGNVNLAIGGTVTWTNQGTNVHTATTTGGGNPVPVDTGGLSSGQSSSLTFTAPGTYSFTSATDCLNGNSTAGYRCGPYTVTVSNAPAAAGPASPSSGAQAPASNTAITINESAGFSPSSLTVKAGQSVTWTNTGTQVHSVVVDSGINPAFDSGGLAPGQSFTQQMNTPGTYTYHSSVDAVYGTDSVSGSTVVTYRYTGRVVVNP